LQFDDDEYEVSVSWQTHPHIIVFPQRYRAAEVKTKLIIKRRKPFSRPDSLTKPSLYNYRPPFGLQGASVYIIILYTVATCIFYSIKPNLYDDRYCY